MSETKEVKEALRKIGLFSLGVIVISQEKLEEVGHELANEIANKENQEEGKRLVREFTGTVNQKIKDTIEKAKAKVEEEAEREAERECYDNIATKSDIEKLAKRFDILEKRFINVNSF